MHFLKLVAQDLYTRMGGDLRNVTVVFPSRRASVFFNGHLYEAAGHKALWAPRYLTISELFADLSPLKVNDPIDTVCRIYRHYVETTQDADTSLDRFYGWGERLLADFDDIDKQLAYKNDDVVRQLFTNIADLHELDSLDYLTPEQQQVLQDFFHDFSLAATSELRQRFLLLWRNMLAIYRRLNDELRAEGLAYEGALFRDVVRQNLADKAEGTFVFVGHNALTGVERELLRQLQRQHRALFYWDYDTYYASATHEAGLFLRENLREFPNLLDEKHFDNLRHIQSVEFVSAPTENAQARSATKWVKDHLGPDPTRTAIVLASEGMLQPVLHALPEEVKDVNITKGYPLGHTLAFSFVEKYFAAAKETDAVTLLANLRSLVEKEAIGKAAEESADETSSPAGPTEPAVPAEPAEATTPAAPSFTDLMNTEAWYYTYTILGRFLNLLDSGTLQGLSLTTLHKLLRYTLRQTSIPFEGEPAIGLQVMGILETRCLDFDNVLILSANEKVLPRVGSDNSFIPYNIRRAFGLTVINHRTAVFAYHFYRLIQRASHVRCVYNSSADGLRTGEMSRFMAQLMIESSLPIRHLTLTSMPSMPHRGPEAVVKTPEMVAGITSLSPSSINTYIECPLKFYYQRIKRLRKPDDPADIIAENTFGSLFHKVAELLYDNLSAHFAKPITASAIENARKDTATLQRFIRQSFNLLDTPVDYNGVIAEVLAHYVQRLLDYDYGLALSGPIIIHALEKPCHKDFSVPCADGSVRTISIGGFIDRLDEVVIEGRQTLRVVDYKTGGKPESLKAADDLSPLFTPAESRPRYLLQTFLYSHVLLPSPKPVAPALYFLNHKIESPLITVAKKPLNDFTPLAPAYNEGLQRVIAEILNPDVPFTPQTEACKNCPYHLLCHA